VKRRKAYKKQKELLKGISGLIAIIFLILPVFFVKDMEAVREIGYLGYFLSSYIGGAVYILPFIVKRLNPLVLLLIGTFGNVADEFFGWYAGTLSLELDKGTKYHKKIQSFVETRGVVAVFVLGVLPLPQVFYTVSAFASGHYKIPLKDYFVANFLGKLIRNGVYILILLYLI